MGSIAYVDSMVPIIRSLVLTANITTLNLAGCAFNLHALRKLARFVVNSDMIREFDVSHCKIAYQGARYIIDAINRNTCLRTFNFSYNDLQSSKFEFAIKIASVLTRHPTMMHLNIAHTNLKREEVMFIALALSTAKTLIALHMTAQGLPYYERIFVRAMVSARVGY